MSRDERRLEWVLGRLEDLDELRYADPYPVNGPRQRRPDYTGPRIDSGFGDTEDV